MLTRLIPRLYAFVGAGRVLSIPAIERLYLWSFFAYKRFIEDPFAALTRRRPELFRGGHVLDIGANVGYTASVFSRAIEREFNVFALEPEPVNLRRLKRVLERSGIGNVIPVEAAASDRSGEASLLINPRHPGDHRLDDGSGASGPAIRVAAVSVDDFVEQHQIAPVAFVKIDVQGAELQVSRGMERLLARQPRIAVAFEFSAGSPASLIAFYFDRGFTIGLLEHDGSIGDVSELASAVRRRGYVDLLATRGVF